MTDGPTTNRTAFGEMPEHVCAECSALRYRQEPSCIDCGAQRPDDGWPPLASAGDPLLGRTIDGRFFVTRRVAKIGQSTLYRASCLNVRQLFGLWVFPAPAGAERQARPSEAMRDDMRRLRDLDSAHAVAAHEYLELPGGWAAVLIEHVEGRPLTDLIAAETPLDLARACRLGTQLLDMLGEALDEGLLHRHLSATHVFVEKKPPNERLRLLGLGLPSVFWQDAAPNEAAGLLSPEQLRGEPPDASSNRYSAAALLYYLLTGDQPGRHWQASESWGVRVEPEAARASQARPADDLPESIDAPLAHLLRRRPEDRPATFDSLRDQLQAIADSQPTPGAAILGGPRTSAQGDSDFEIADDLLESGDYFTLSEKTSVFDGDLSTPPSARTLEEMSLSASLEKRIPSHELPNDLGPNSSVAFWADEAKDTGNFGWVNGHRTGVSKQRRAPSLPFTPSLCSASPAGTCLVAADTKDRLWRADGFPAAEFTEVDGLESAPSSLAPCGDVLLAGDQLGRLVALEADRQPTALLETIDRSAIVAVAADADTNSVVAAAESGRVYVGELTASMHDEDWRRVRSKEPAQDVSVAPGVDAFAVLRQNGRVEMRRHSQPKTELANFTCREPSHAIALSADGQLVAVVGDAAVRLHHAYSGQTVATFPCASHMPMAVFFGPTNDLFGVCHGDGKLELWNLATGQRAEAAAARQGSNAKHRS